MPGMNRGGGGGQMQPFMGGGGDPMQPPPQIGLNPNSALQGGADKIASAQQALQRAEQACAQGDGASCQLAQRLRQQMQQMQMQQSQQVGLAGSRGQGGTMGIGRGGGGRTDPNSYAQALLGGMYNKPMGGGGGW